MGIPEELAAIMDEVATCAKEEGVPGPLAGTITSVAKNLLVCYTRLNDKSAGRFARMVLREGKMWDDTESPIERSVYQLPNRTKAACTKLISMLKILAQIR